MGHFTGLEQSVGRKNVQLDRYADRPPNHSSNFTLDRPLVTNGTSATSAKRNRITRRRSDVVFLLVVRRIRDSRLGLDLTRSAANMVFTQSRGFVLGETFGLPRRPLR